MINTNTAEILSARYLLKKELGTRQFYQFCSNKSKELIEVHHLIKHFNLIFDNQKIYSSVYSSTLYRKLS